MTFQEIIEALEGEIKGEPPPFRVYQLVQQILTTIKPLRKWGVHRSWLNDRVEISVQTHGMYKGMPLLLTWDIGYHLHEIMLRLRRDRLRYETLQNGFPQPTEVLKELNTQEKVDKIFENHGVLDKVNELRELTKDIEEEDKGGITLWKMKI